MLHETLEYLGIAFICSVLLIIMSKIILQALIRRPADYYNARELREEELMLNAGGISITNEHETNPEGEIIQDAHLEAQLGDSEPAEPEEIIPEIPASVHESIEIMQDEAVPSDEPDAEEPIEQSTEDKFSFHIKAKTSRTPKSRNKQAEEAEEELEHARAAIDEAKSQEAVSEPASEWTESYADIRRSLEKAFTDRTSAEEPHGATDVTEDTKTVHQADRNSASSPKKKNNRRRKPSMNMNKKELTDIAESRGIEVPPEATKREILDLIYSDRRKRY